MPSRLPRARVRLLMGLASALLVLATTVPTAGAEVTYARTVDFAGYSWGVKASTGPAGPGPNRFSDSTDNVWVDGSGALHLAVTQRDGAWYAAEVVLDQSLGYGTYEFTVETPVGDLDPNVVLGMFTWSDEPAFAHREIDVEFSRWGDADAPTNAQYVVQPYERSGNLHRFVQPDEGATTHTFRWAPRWVSFRSAAESGKTYSRWRYRGSDVPRAGGEHVRLNLWLFRGEAPSDDREVEVVLSGFSFRRR